MKKPNSNITLIFDLDETVIDSSHRTPNNPDGTLNLDAYMAMHSQENVAEDRLLPLAKTMKAAIKHGYKVAVLTARDMAWFDYAYLLAAGIHPGHVYSRDKCKTKRHYNMSDGQYKQHWFAHMPKTLTSRHCIMFDDSKAVKAAMRAIGVTCLCAHKVNARLFKDARVK